jgi:uncharacterized radical SAM superfamily Fe-S cluster-containing enzyme
VGNGNLTREILKKTQSLCPVCLSRIPGKIVAESGQVYLEKSCNRHGDYKVIIWRNTAQHYLKWAEFAGNRSPIGPRKRLTEYDGGCPYDCGICPQHEQDTASAAIMTTNRCNLHCPICFTHGDEQPVYEPDLDSIKRMYQLMLDTCGTYPVELCGGEPTVRDDLPQVVAIGEEMGFDHIQINSNGIRISQDKEYLGQLKEAGATIIYLQFDGVNDEVYRHTRGANLFDLKVQAISNCAEVKIGVMLVPTIAPSVNFHQIGDIIQFAKRWVPTVKGVYFQPISYFGRYPQAPREEDRVTIPDLLKALEEQTRGELKEINFVPPVCEHPHCSFSGFAVLREDGRLSPTTSFQPRQISEDGAERSRRFTKQRWRFVEEDGVLFCSERQHEENPFGSLLQRFQREYLCISGMAFQDVWNIDLERLKKCCIHIITSEGKMIPLCAKYVTSTNGQRLYPGIA